jgi:hypothetical protein
MLSLPKMQKMCHSIHEHWKNCLNYPEAHIFVLCLAPPKEEEDEDLYASPEESLHVAQLMSSMTEYLSDSAGFCAVRNNSM